MDSVLLVWLLNFGAELAVVACCSSVLSCPGFTFFCCVSPRLHARVRIAVSRYTAAVPLPSSVFVCPSIVSAYSTWRRWGEVEAGGSPDSPFGADAEPLFPSH